MAARWILLYNKENMSGSSLKEWTTLIDKIKAWVGNHAGFLLAVISLVALCFCMVSLKGDLDKRERLPQVYIELNGATLDDIDSGEKSEKYGGNYLNIDFDGEELSFSNVEISGRGNLSWKQKKRNYNLKFDQNVSLFGMGKSKKWVLLANYLDSSYLRNDIAFFVERMLGRSNTVEGKYIELYVNNNYHGLYYVVPKVEINTARININDPFGVLMELENLHAIEEDCNLSIENDCMVVKDLVKDENEEIAVREFMADFDELILAAKEGDYEKVSNLIDVESFAEYYLVSEFTVNPDAYVSSFFLYKDGLDDKIHIGPGWDFDLAMANRLWGDYDSSNSDGNDGTDFYSPYTTQAMRRYTFGREVYDDEQGSSVVVEPSVRYSKFMYYLIDMPEFFDEVRKVYSETMSGRRDELKQYLQNKLASIRDAALRDSKKWETNFEEESAQLVDWATKRYDFFETKYSNKNDGLIKFFKNEV